MDGKYTKVQALRAIQRIIKEGGELCLSKHYKQRMLERGVSNRDILHVIQTGKIHREPEPHIKTGKLIYTIEGLTVDGDKMRLPVAIYEEESRVVVVTVIK